MTNKEKRWIKAAGIRAVKTFAQSLASMVTVGAAIDEINWPYITAVAATAAVLSVLTSIAGLPEAPLEGDE